MDETLIRKRIQLNQLPPFLFNAIAAVAARYVFIPLNVSSDVFFFCLCTQFTADRLSHVSHRHTPHPNGFRAAVKLGDDYASRARSAIDIDEPSIDNLQAIVLLAIAYTASGKGRKAFMLISTCIRPSSNFRVLCLYYIVKEQHI